MAYQPKSYRKLFATTATAAMVATAVAPAAGAAGLSFTDVEGQYVAPVQWLVDQNITSGVSATEFGTHTDITRGQAAIFIANALGLDTVNAPDAGFTDANDRNDRTRGAINAVKAAGILNGTSETTFGTDLKITRQAVAVAIARAYGLDQQDVAGVELPFTDVYAGSQYEQPIKSFIKFGITQGKTATTFGAQDNVTRGVFAVFLQKAHLAKEALATPAVESVSAINAKQIKVEFNKVVKAGTLTGGAEVLASYTVDGVNPSRVTLAEDKKSIVLTFGAATADLVAKTGKYLEVEIKDIKTATGDKVAAYQAPFLFDDKTAPTASVSSKAQTATVEFSELLATSGGVLTGATVSVDGVAGAAYTVTADTDTVAGASAIKLAGLSAGTHTISIVGATDLAGNKLPTYTGTVNITTDTVAPTVTSLTAEGNNVRVKFSEPVVDVAGFTSNAVKISANGVDILANAASAVDDEGTEFLINATSFITTGDFTNTTVTVAAGSEDASGNASSAYSKSLTITKDTTDPVVAESFVEGLDLVVKFSETVAAGSTALTGVSTPSIQFTDADGVVHSAAATTLSGVSYGYDANGDGDKTDSGEDRYLIISTNDAAIKSGTTLKAGTYKLSLTADAVADSATNGNAATTVTFTVGSASDVLANVQAVATQVSPGVLQYTFSNGVSPVELTSAQLKAANFTIDGAAVSSDSKIYFYGNKSTVRVELPAEYVYVNGTRTLSVANIVDEDGNTLSTTAANIQSDVNLTENVKPKAVSVSLLDAKNVTVQMSEVLASAPTTGVELWVNGTQVATTDVAFSLVADANGRNTILKLTTTAKSLSNSDSIVVKFTSANDAADAATNTVQVGQVSK